MATQFTQPWKFEGNVETTVKLPTAFGSLLPYLVRSHTKPNNTAVLILRRDVRGCPTCVSAQTGFPPRLPI